MSEASIAPGHDAKVLGLIGTGHFLSHFYLLTLPPLFPLLKAEYGISYAALGLILTIYNLASGVSQVPVGFIVDRIGARPVLMVGLALEAGAIGLVGAFSTYWALLLLIIFAGMGHSVFHPADYSILSSSVNQNRIGRAFSIHTFSGHLGTAAAPATMIFLSVLLGWRTALMAVGLFGILVMLAMLTQNSILNDDVTPKKQKKSGEGGTAAPAKSGFALIFSTPMLLFFFFFVMTSMTSSGMQSFSVTALTSLHGTALSSANAALTGFLFASAIGVLVGGVIADRTTRHNLVAAGAFAVTAATVFLVGAVSLPVVLLVTVLTLGGLMQGIIRPARDMMVRMVAPKGSTGKAFGFVSTGIAVGGALTPVLFGWIIDQGRPGLVFVLLGIFMIVALATIITPKKAAAA